ncbi:hypothetical protein JMF89_11965 [Clostridiaceae bacterium UIB06]|uniref:Uncharacterized protein n=1 Tax=Clostridium thailandense TaxID=2794346 RepID=A0A949U287_9CLOT|nr:DUF6762 family protein [Clostridium thailandense]MBV7274994.1 hypothetical protein [Clostridium thailandense]MCH5137913.1 hypothetical protein [Clostridiaceae bacterium UIB06]
MDFSSLVLMEKDKNTGFMVNELGSYEVGEGAEYIKKMYYDGEKINIYFDTNVDVEEWEYSAIFDLFDESEFIKEEFAIEQVDDEYNPTWLIKFDYEQEHSIMLSRLNSLCTLIKTYMKKVFSDIKGKEEEYK